MSRTTEFDAEALEYAARYYGISLDEPGAEERLRKSLAFASKRFDLACGQLGRNLLAAFTPAYERFFGKQAGQPTQKETR